MIKVCYTDIKSVVINNGFFSEPLSVTRGLRQGCPLSCLCFNLIVELIAIKIDSIEGIAVGTKTKKLGQYADDLWLSIKHKKECYLELFKELTNFAEFSGLRINYDKTEILRLGSLIKSDARFYADFPIQWTDKPIKILGIWVSTSDMSKLNFEKDYGKSCECMRYMGEKILHITWKNTYCQYTDCAAISFTGYKLSEAQRK